MEIFAGIMPFLGIVIFAMFLNVYVSRNCIMVARDIVCKLNKKNDRYIIPKS